MCGLTNACWCINAEAALTGAQEAWRAPNNVPGGNDYPWGLGFESALKAIMRAPRP